MYDSFQRRLGSKLAVLSRLLELSTVASVEVMPDGGTTDFKFCSKTSAGWMQKG